MLVDRSAFNNFRAACHFTDRKETPSFINFKLKHYPEPDAMDEISGIVQPGDRRRFPAGRKNRPLIPASGTQPAGLVLVSDG
jgi:hypothetical protein